ncbi:hypothetical protein GGF37_004949, partial [Kickxella alabastrina]
MGSDRSIGEDAPRRSRGAHNRGGRGRGAYYRELYGNKTGLAGHDLGNTPRSQRPQDGQFPGIQDELGALLASMDGKQYGHYKQLSGRRYEFRQFSLFFDHIQADAYAPPSRIRVRVKQSAALFPATCFSTNVRAVAAAHYLTQLIHRTLACLQSGHERERGGASGGWRSAKGGVLSVDCPGQEVIERTSVSISGQAVEARLTASMPAAGRSIVGESVQRMLLETLPQLVEQALLHAAVDAHAMQLLIECVEDQESLRAQLGPSGLVAFVGNGSVLPRRSGVSGLPLAVSSAVEFRSPHSMLVSFVLPNRGRVSGMGVARGVTLICGGGFNGKSTLLQAIESGVYNHIPGDGRELVVAEALATKIKAEEGRSVCSTDIRPFISRLPFGKDTAAFSTADASGSTSMAASIQEAMEAGATMLLFDEDTCATNFLVRDSRMQQLVAQSKEPITPLIARVRELWEAKGVSSMLVIGGCGDYLDVADTVIDMCEYAPADATARARDIVAHIPVLLEPAPTEYGPVPCRLVGFSAELTGSFKPPKALTRWAIVLFPSGGGGFTDDAGDADAGNTDAEFAVYGADEAHAQSILDLAALDQLVSS